MVHEKSESIRFEPYFLNLLGEAFVLAGRGPNAQNREGSVGGAHVRGFLWSLACSVCVSPSFSFPHPESFCTSVLFSFLNLLSFLSFPVLPNQACLPTESLFFLPILTCFCGGGGGGGSSYVSPGTDPSSPQLHSR